MARKPFKSKPKPINQHGPATKRRNAEPMGGMTGLQYLKKVRERPCEICGTHPTHAHHCIHGRHSSAKASHFDAIALCEGCHQGLIDTTRLAIHQAPQTWRDVYGPDTQFIPRTRLAILVKNRIDRSIRRTLE